MMAWIKRGRKVDGLGHSLEEEFINIGDRLAVGDEDWEGVGMVPGILTWAAERRRWAHYQAQFGEEDRKCMFMFSFK